MHEASVLRALVAKVIESAAGARVTSIHVAVGTGSHLSTEQIARALPIFAHGSVAEHARVFFEAARIDDDPADVRLVSIEVE